MLLSGCVEVLIKHLLQRAMMPHTWTWRPLSPKPLSHNTFAANHHAPETLRLRTLTLSAPASERVAGHVLHHSQHLPAHLDQHSLQGCGLRAVRHSCRLHAAQHGA